MCKCKHAVVSFVLCWGKQGIKDFLDTFCVMSYLYSLFCGCSFLGVVIRGAQWNHEKFCGGGAHRQQGTQ